MDTDQSVNTSETTLRTRRPEDRAPEIVDEALFLFVAHDVNPRALGPKVRGFVQAQNWFQDLSPVITG